MSTAMGPPSPDPVMYMLGQIDSKLDTLASDQLETIKQLERLEARTRILENAHTRFLGMAASFGALLAYLGHDKIAMLFTRLISI